LFNRTQVAGNLAFPVGAFPPGEAFPLGEASFLVGAFPEVASFLEVSWLDLALSSTFEALQEREKGKRT
jgi:hypothetical protein